MKKSILIILIFASSLFGYYCELCEDTLNDTSSVISFKSMLEEKFSEINEEIKEFEKNLDWLINITAYKLQRYTAIKDLKKSELSELEKINFLIEKLIEQENIRIKALNIKAKSSIADEVLNDK